jgi:hypothetical protein
MMVKASVQRFRGSTENTVTIGLSSVTKLILLDCLSEHRRVSSESSD